MEWILLGMIITLVSVGLWLANGTQDFVDQQNARIRQDQKWRDNNAS
jgi:hypothetical protein